MNAIIDAALSRSRTTLSALLLILIAGTVAYVDIPKESDPDVNIPIIYIRMHHDGISPEDAERLLLRPMETELRGIEGVKEMRANSFEGGASVVLEFDAGFDADKALTDVREKVDLAQPDLPDETDEPTVHEVNISLFPVLVVTLSGDIPERNLLHLARGLRDEIERINAVLEAKLTGNREELIEVVVDPLRMDSYGVDSIEVLQTIARSNMLVAAGTLDTGNGRFPIKVPGLYENIQDILTQPIKADGDAVVTISDIAYVQRTFKDRNSIARLSGEPSIGLEISKRTGENIIDSIERVREVVDKAAEDWPSGVQVTFSQDRSTNIRRMLIDLQNNVLSAIILVMVVIVGALGWRSGVLVGVAIPGSFLLGILVLAMLGLTINMVVLFSLILAVGMLVDGAIVVTEFADRKMVEGAPRMQAYADAAKRMAWPITASTATTLAAFMPLIFWPGIVGEFMKFLPITLVATLSASLLMALLFVPALGARFGKPSAQDPDAAHDLALADTGDLTKITGGTGLYIRVLRGALRHPAKILAGAFAMLIMVQYIYAVAGNGVEFFPEVEPDSAKIHIHARGNLSTNEKAALVLDIEREVLALDEFKSIYTFVGKPGGGGQELAEDVIGSIQLEFKDWQERRPAQETLEEIVKRASTYAGIIVEPTKQKAGPPSGKPLQLQVRSDNPTDLVQTASLIREQFNAMSGLANIEDDRDIPGIEWRLTVDRAQAAKFGADVALIGNYVQMVTKGLRITGYRPDDSDEEMDVVVRYPEVYRKLNQLQRIRIITKKGLVPIDGFIDWSPKPKVGTIKRVDASRVMTIKADVLPGILADEKAQELRDWLAGVYLPETVEVVFKGEDEEQKKAKAFLIKAFGAALFVMAIILVTQFNSFYSAFLILSAVIMSTIGVMLGLMITGKPFGIVMTGVGVIALAGIVVNNNIVLIDTFDHMKKRSANAIDAILRTGAQRLRPVLLTTVTTILGLLPMVFQISIDFVTREITVGAPSTQWWVSLATAIVFGLGFASILTLIVTPCALMVRENLTKWRAGGRLRRDSLAPAPAE
ncbi:efflux RND transporter permease subunit [Alphaproteobacteria bacterium]|nr:efflux RND transporter permease subunit [Alphaproteobacteria bacterium]